MINRFCVLIPIHAFYAKQSGYLKKIVVQCGVAISLVHKLYCISVADLAIVPWVPLKPPPLWMDLVLRSIDDEPNGTPPWLKETKKAVALACFTRFQSKQDQLFGRASTFFVKNEPKWVWF